MTSRRFSIFALVLALVALVAWRWFGRDPLHPATEKAEAASRGPQSPAAAPAEPGQLTSSVAPGMPMVRTPSIPPQAVVAASPAAASSPASRPEPSSQGVADLERVRFMLRDFQTRMGENPVGSNAEVMRQVMGGNSAGAKLGPPEGQSLNAAGELLDRWGTPYFFHQLSGNTMEIRSAGPDRQMWTVDDLVTK